MPILRSGASGAAGAVAQFAAVHSVGSVTAVPALLAAAPRASVEMARVRTAAAALVAAPSSVTAGTAIAVQSTGGGAVLAFRLAVLAGSLTLVGVVVALSQETLRSWISYRAEQRRADAEAHAIRTLVVAATAGPDRDAADARQKRRDARAFAEVIGLSGVGRTSLGEAMRTSRGQAGRGARSGPGGWPIPAPAADADDADAPRLEMAAGPDRRMGRYDRPSGRSHG